jgi:hypothetical protein
VSAVGFVATTGAGKTGPAGGVGFVSSTTARDLCAAAVIVAMAINAVSE